MRVFLGEFQKTTQARIAALEKDIRDILEEVKEHYKGVVDLIVTGPTEVEVMKDVTLNVSAKRAGKPAADALKDARIEWTVNQAVKNSGPSWWFSPLEETVMTITVTATKEISGKKVVLGSTTHQLNVKKPKDDKKDGKTDDKKDAAATAPSCSYEYTDWGECSQGDKEADPDGESDEARRAASKGRNPRWSRAARRRRPRKTRETSISTACAAVRAGGPVTSASGTIPKASPNRNARAAALVSGGQARGAVREGTSSSVRMTAERGAGRPPSARTPTIRRRRMI